MRGYVREARNDDEADSKGTLSPWEELVVDAVGNVIDFWNFKRSQGRVWALLYLRGHALSAGEIQQALGLSKGGVSMLLRELEQWGVLRRVRAPRDDVWRYAAQTDLMKMIGRVLSEREASLVRSVREDLEAAEADAKAAHADKDTLARLRRMRTLAQLVDQGLSTFLKTARVDAHAVLQVLGPESNDDKKGKSR